MTVLLMDCFGDGGSKLTEKRCELSCVALPILIHRPFAPDACTALPEQAHILQVAICHARVR